MRAINSVFYGEINMPAIKTSELAQKEIITYYSGALTAKGVQIIKSSRGARHLRINYSGDVQQLFNSIHPCSIKPSDVTISGSYVTQELTIKKDIETAKADDKIYLVVTVTSKGVLKTKQLTPDKFGVAGKTVAKSTFLSEIKNGIASLPSVPDNIKAVLNDILAASQTTGGLIQGSNIEAISDFDINIIAKDFGELSGAWWWMNRYEAMSTGVYYPLQLNEPLVDYYIITGNKKSAVSAKANEGAPPSIDAIASLLRTTSYTDQLKENARKAIIAISEKSTVDGIIDAAKNLKHEGYAWLKTNLFSNRDFTAADCETILKNYKTPADLLSLLRPYYDKINRSASLDTAKRIVDTNGKRWGLIISPLGYAVVDTLNNNQTYLSVLNDAAKGIVASQIYMKINKNQKTVSYRVAKFSTSDFKFKYNANAGQPALKKISFEMSKRSGLL